MNATVWSWCARGLVWWIRRNPMYLLSAACMAVGARLYLVSPESYAGDVGLILLTLGVLQAYKWAVTTILLLLHRSRRCPEDECSLLLVAALFWTGPLAATVEMSARQARQGLLCGIGVLIFALVELAVVRRSLGLRLSIAGRGLAAACLILLVVAPTQLQVTTGYGTNELFLYFCWWLLAGIALLAVGCVRRHVPGRSVALDPLGAVHLLRELAFITIVLAATATHLVGMNYAFVGHARPFYGAPLIVVVAAAAFDYLRRAGWAPAALRFAVAGLPAVAVGLALQPFDRAVPLHALPLWLRDPLFATLALATIAWWFGAWRLRSFGLFHVGNLGLAATVLRGAAKLLPPAVAPLPQGAGLPARDIVLLALFALTIYLLIIACVRRSRAEALLALVILQPAVCGAVWERTPVAALIVGLVVCWSLLAAVHLGVRWPSLSAVGWPAALLIGLAWYYDSAEPGRWLARANTLALVAGLLFVGQLWPGTRYRLLGAGALGANILYFGGRGIAAGRYPVATLVVTGSFLLLGVATAISWNKRVLLRMARASEHGAETGGVQP